MAKKIRIGGVPEHFNFPWMYGMKHQCFESNNIYLHWQHFPGGTGAMANALKSNELDVAIILTEGAINFKLQNYPISIIRYFVQSPLNWGIHTCQNSHINKIETIFDKKYAISRIGSGSHLIAKVHAFQNNIQLNENQFVIVNDIHGAIQSLNSGESDIFFWEKFTTKPYVDRHILKRIGEFPTPWPCFVIVSRTAFYNENIATIDKLLDAIDEINFTLKSLSNLSQQIASEYKLETSDVEIWLQSVQWASKNEISNSELHKIAKILNTAKIITEFTSDFDFKSC